MNFLTEITALGNQGIDYIEKDNWLIVKTGAAFYAVNKNEMLGGGASGSVYMAYAIATDGEVLEDKPFAAKVHDLTRLSMFAEAALTGTTHSTSSASKEHVPDVERASTSWPDPFAGF